MPIIRLSTERTEKPWGRRSLWPAFQPVAPTDPPIGEIRFVTAQDPDPPLLVKYLFTSEKLSVQVHPDDARARASGEPRGKSEAWLVLEADPGAVIGLGLKRRLDRPALRAAALEGSLEAEIDWRPAKAGDFFYLPAGTIHALGGGLTVIEVQQNSDTTYRLYDYGRDRALHIDEGVAAAITTPFPASVPPTRLSPGRTILIDSATFVIERLAGPQQFDLSADPERPCWLIPVSGPIGCAGNKLEAGSVWRSDEPARIELASLGDLLIASPPTRRVAMRS